MIERFIRWFQSFGILAAAIAVGVWSGVLLCDWFYTVSVEEVSCVSKDPGQSRPRAALRVIADVSPSVRPRGGGRNWIAEAWSGPRRTGAFKVTGGSDDGRVDTRGVDAKGVRRGFGETLRQALRKRGKAPIEERNARLAENPFGTPEARRSAQGFGQGGADSAVYEGDVYISGLPMINQGNRAYCAIASAARVLYGYGIEMSMDDIAAMAHASEMGGTHPVLWENAIRQVAHEHGLELKVVPALTETMTPLSNLLYNYNQTARDMNYPELYTWNYANAGLSDYAAFDDDRQYDVQREVMLSSARRCEAFDESVTARIDESDPIFWTVLLGDVPEAGVSVRGTGADDGRSAHMRLIIGYNEDRGEILYTDSWGEGHELKRMDAADALSITTAMSYLTE